MGRRSRIVIPALCENHPLRRAAGERGRPGQSLFAIGPEGFDRENARRQIDEWSSDRNPDQAPERICAVRLNSRANIRSWEKRLTDEERTRIRAGVEDIASRFYGDEDW